MASDTSITSPLLSGNPFSDLYVIGFDDEPEHAHTALTDRSRETLLPAKAKITVPIIDTLPRLTVWSPPSSISASSCASSPTQTSFHGPIKWNDTDLVYLLRYLFNGLLSTDELTFSPPLADLPTAAFPINLHLYQNIPLASISPEAFSKHAPIGTGRPQSLLLIAKSEACKTAEAARASLARNILSNHGFVSYMLDKYNVLATLYSSSTHILRSLQRGMVEMLGVSESEWIERYEQLASKVDGACGLDARLEVFLLGVGVRECEEWIGVVDTVISMEAKDRAIWREMYGDAASFLSRSVREMGQG